MGAILPLSSASFGAQAEGWGYAMRIAEREINDAGGLLGKTLKLDIQDSGAVVERGEEITNDFLAKYDTRILLNGDLTEAAVAAEAIAMEADALFMISVAGGSQVVDLDTKDLAFQVPVSAIDAGKAAAEVVYQDGYRRIGIISTATMAYAKQAATGFKAQLLTHDDIEIVSEYEITDAAFSDYQSVLASVFEPQDMPEPDAVYLVVPANFGHQFLLTWKASFAGFTGQWYLESLMRNQPLFDVVGQAAEGMRGVLPGSGTASDALLAKIQAAAGSSVATSTRLGDNYDVVYATALAIAKAGTTDPLAVRDVLREVTGAPGTVVRPGEFKRALELIAAGEDIDYEGVNGSLSFNDDGSVTGGVYERWEVQNQRFEMIGTWQAP